MSRILVTGGYGYIGGHLVMELARNGHEVVVLDNMMGACDWKFPNGVVFMRASISNQDAVSRAMQGVDAVYHMADRLVSIDDVSRDKNSIIKTVKANTYGTAVVLSCARAAGVDNVTVSSSYAVYGSMMNAIESGPVLPCGVYGCSKLGMESVCAAFHTIGMNVRVLRIYDTWGGKGSKSLVDAFVRHSAGICGDGTQTRDFVYIGDVVQALVDSMKWDTFLYNIGTGVEITLHGLWSLINPDREPDISNKHCNDFMVDGITNAYADMSETFAKVRWRPSVNVADMTPQDFKKLCS